MGKIYIDPYEGLSDAELLREDVGCYNIQKLWDGTTRIVKCPHNTDSECLRGARRVSRFPGVRPNGCPLEKKRR